MVLSISAVDGGKCVDTSMGLTPLEGLVMGTRSGDIDPTCIEFIVHKENLSLEQVMDIVNKNLVFLVFPVFLLTSVILMRLQKLVINVLT